MCDTEAMRLKSSGRHHAVGCAAVAKLGLPPLGIRQLTALAEASQLDLCSQKSKVICFVSLC